jgi:hypothetical protein
MVESVRWTIVQHSGAGYGDKPEFKRGLEVVAVPDAATYRRIEILGGKIFVEYKEASDYAQAEMYPEGYNGMVPVAPGRFARFALDGLPLYLPPRLNSDAETF